MHGSVVVYNIYRGGEVFMCVDWANWHISQQIDRKSLPMVIFYINRNGYANNKTYNTVMAIN